MLNRFIYLYFYVLPNDFTDSSWYTYGLLLSVNILCVTHSHDGYNLLGTTESSIGI